MGTLKANLRYRIKVTALTHQFPLEVKSQGTSIAKALQSR